MSVILHRRRPDLDAFRTEMDRLFRDVLPTASDDASRAWAPATDVVETDDAHVLSMDLPGVEADAVDVHFADGTLRVSGQRETERSEAGARFHRVERSRGRFVRAFHLGPDVDADAIDASYDAGVLTVEVRKTEARKPRQIAVRTRATSPSEPDAVEA